MITLKQSGFTLIEMMISLFVATLVVTAVMVTFQNFTSFNNWVIHYSYTQKHAAYELSVLKQKLEGFTHILSLDSLGLSLSRAVLRADDRAAFTVVSCTSSEGEQIEATDANGKLALAYGVIFGGMVQVENALYVVDTGNHVIRKIDTVLQTNTVFAGQEKEFGAVDGASTAARFRNPTGITAYNNALYVSDTGNHAIRKIDIATQEVTTFAGTLGKSGNTSKEKELSYFAFPTGITVDNTNGVFYVSDTGNHSVKKIVGTTVFSFLGNIGEQGKNADTVPASDFLSFSLHTPTHLVYDSTLHVLYLNDFENKRILSVEEDDRLFTLDSGKYFGALQIYDDALSSHYVLYQEMEGGDIRFFKPIEKTHGLFLNVQNDLSSLPQNYWMHSFLYNSGIYFMWGLHTTDNQWGVFQIDPLADTASSLFGVTGEFGELSIFDPSAYVFSPFTDTIGNASVFDFRIRENPTSMNPRQNEFLIRYYFGDDQEDASAQLHYSLIIGDD